ncbi:MAG: IS110 family transposase [Solirubrobacterales bacterium]
MISFAQRQRAQQAAAVVGIDAGKFTHTLVVRPQGKADTKPCTFTNTRAGFEEAVAFIAAATGGAAAGQILVGIEFAGHYGFPLAHYLHALGFPIVSVLAVHTKRWKDVAHNQPLKTDAKDAGSITDLVGQGHFVSFPFLGPAYADLRYLTAGRERLSVLRRAALTQLRSLLQVVFPEIEGIFPLLSKRTPLHYLLAYPSPAALLGAPKRQVLKLLHDQSRGHVGLATYQRLVEAARTTLAVPQAQERLGEELSMTIERLLLYDRQMARLHTKMREVLHELPEAAALLSIPNVAPLSAAVFLGSVGDPRCYSSSREVLKLAGLSLIERSSGLLKGSKHISKRGRPLLRHAVYLLAVRNVTKQGMFRTTYEQLLQRNGGRKIAALVAISRKILRLMYSVARDRRQWTPEPPRFARRAA